MASLEGKSVLVVDDEYEIVDYLTSQLARMGMQPHGVNSARAALEIVHKEDIDIVITDNMMPGMSGIGLIRELRKVGKGMPVILFSGCLPQNIDHLCAELRVSCLLDKPVSAARLEEAIRDSL